MNYRHKDLPKQFSDPKPPKKEKKKPLGLKRNLKPATLIEKLDRVFSQFVRRSCANELGIVSCYTCHVVMHWKKAQAGHFVSRKHMATRWDLRNVFPQCNICNENLNGNLKVYAERLTKEYGKDILLELSVLAATEKKFSKPELEEMIQEYKEKLAILK